LISSSGGREAVKLWDVGTRQELLTLPGAGSLLLGAAWSADGDTILAGEPWQIWSAPSWEEIAVTERATLTRPLGNPMREGQGEGAGVLHPAVSSVNR
jgi:hypothetical protein